ncbi:MAG: hypothetical protein NTW10_13500 [Bacteroidetes bacterium]|nr:hypothetical protein [Bacteroidota bacterium]
MTVRFENTIRISLFTLGFSALATQVFLIRECFSVFNGNELVIGIVMANWMLLTGAGAYIARFYCRMKGRLTFLLFLQFLFSILPILMLLKLDLWKADSLPAGTIPGLIPVIRSMLLFQLPFCLLNGFLFVAFVYELSEVRMKNALSVSYTLETVGGMVAGILVNVFILTFSGIYTGLHAVLFINLMVCMLFCLTSASRLQKFIMLPVSLLFMVVPFFADLDAYTVKLFYPDQQVIYHKYTPYGKLDVTMNARQLNYFENGLLLFSSRNEIGNEESVHFAMAQHPNPETILVVSGGISGTLTEILKYNPARIDYVELDPAITDIGRKYSKILDNKRIHVIHADARRFIRHSNEKYDVVLINLPEPLSLLINRYYSREFLVDLKKVLNPGGVICESLPASSDYMSKKAAATNSTLVQTLKTRFRIVMILPGQRNYFLASDSALSSDIPDLIRQRGISTVYVNPWYLDVNSLKERSEYIHSHLNTTAEVNSDFRPLAFFLQMRYWNSMFEWSLPVSLIFILVLLVVIVFTLNRITVGLFTGGFTASSLQLMILVSFQVIYGYVFLATGIILALFMAGLAAGAFSFPRLIPVPSEKDYLRVQFTLAFYSLGFPFVILALNLPGFSEFLVRIIFIFLIISLSFIIGLEFSLASALGRRGITEKVSSGYSADLFGSAFGAIATILLLLPFLGMVNSCLVIALMNLFSAGFLFLRPKIL